jgi:hypothetical protein
MMEGSTESNKSGSQIMFTLFIESLLPYCLSLCLLNRCHTVVHCVYWIILPYCLSLCLLNHCCHTVFHCVYWIIVAILSLLNHCCHTVFHCVYWIIVTILSFTVFIESLLPYCLSLCLLNQCYHTVFHCVYWIIVAILSFTVFIESLLLYCFSLFFFVYTNVILGWSGISGFNNHSTVFQYSSHTNLYHQLNTHLPPLPEYTHDTINWTHFHYN